MRGSTAQQDNDETTRRTASQRAAWMAGECSERDRVLLLLFVGLDLQIVRGSGSPRSICST